MMRTVLLGDICDIKIGRTPPRKQPQWFSSSHGMKWASIKDMGNTGKYISQTNELLTMDAISKFNIPIIPAGTLLMSFKLTVGRLGFTKYDMCSNEAIAQLPIKAPDIVDKNYLYYYLKNFNFDSLSSTSSIATAVNSKTVKNISVNLPPLDQQKKIANILGSLDEKIELNRHMNETLEQLGQALFCHYFVDNPEAKNWNEGTFGDIMNITMGQSPPGKSYNDNGDGVVFYQGRADFGSRYPNVRLFTTDPRRFAKVGDVLLTVRAPVGDVNQASERCCIGRGLAAISSRTGAASFCYYYCRQLKADFLEYNSEGTVFGSINSKQLKALKLKIPPIGLVEKFENEVAVIDKTITLNSYQVKTLVVLCDSLLPKLISGEIEV